MTTCDLDDAIDSDHAAPARTDHKPAAVALAVAAGHLIEAGVHAHRFMNLADASRRLGISRVRVTGLSALMPLAPEIQSEILALCVGDPLGNLSERALLEVVAGHADWRVQRWWWSVLAQPFDPNWLAEWIPPKTAFPSGKRARSGDQAIGDLPLGKLVELVVRRRGHRELALALAAGHLTEAAISAHRYRNQHDVANQLGVSKARVNRLVSLTTLAPDIQEQLLHLERGAYLGDLSERTVRVLVAGHGDWAIQRWWWSLLAQPFEPDWRVNGLPARTAFPSGRGCRRCDRGLGDVPLRELADLVARRPGRHEVSASREALLTALADGGAGAPPMSTAVRLTLAKPASELAVDFERLHGHRPPSHHPDYLRRRVAWAVQAEKLGGLPKPISGKMMELKDHLPVRWREAFADIARVHVTRVHRVERRSAN